MPPGKPHGTRRCCSWSSAAATGRRATTPSPTARSSTSARRSPGCCAWSPRTPSGSSVLAAWRPCGISDPARPRSPPRRTCCDPRRSSCRPTSRTSPSALFYTLDAHGGTATLRAASGIPTSHPAVPVVLDAAGRRRPWDIDAVLAGRTIVIDDLGAARRCRPVRGTTRPSGGSLCPGRPGRPAGRLHARRPQPLPPARRGVPQLPRARRRAGRRRAGRRPRPTRPSAAGPRSSSELDRAKTAFFTNVSHEFRTPLTLLLGPVEDALGDRAAPLPPAQRERIEVVQRNALRLLKLVNTLLDFSRLESGRLESHSSRPTWAGTRPSWPVPSPARSTGRPVLEVGLPTCRTGVGRPGAVGQGGVQPPVQRLEVHLRRGRSRARRPGPRRAGEGAGDRHRHRHRGGRAGAAVRKVLPGLRQPRPGPTRARGSAWRWWPSWSALHGGTVGVESPPASGPRSRSCCPSAGPAAASTTCAEATGPDGAEPPRRGAARPSWIPGRSRAVAGQQRSSHRRSRPAGRRRSERAGDRRQRRHA